MQARHSFLLSIFEKLGTPLLAAVAESTERDRIQAQGAGRKHVEPTSAEEAGRVAALLKATAEMGFTLSRQLDLRMAEPAEADGVRLTLATLASPLVANLYRVNGRTPNSEDIERISAALQAVTMFADHYNAAADANIRMQQIDQDFAPADGPQVQLMMLHALMPAMNAVSTFSFGQPEKIMLQEVMARLNQVAATIRKDLFSNLSERDALRAEISLLRSAAMTYSQVHFTEMSKLMFLDEAARDAVDLAQRRQVLWTQVDQRLEMLRIMAETLATGAAALSGATTDATSPAPAAPPASDKPASPFAGFKPKEEAPVPFQPVVVETPVAAEPIPAPVALPASPPPPVDKSNPFASFKKPVDTASGGDQA